MEGEYIYKERERRKRKRGIAGAYYGQLARYSCGSALSLSKKFVCGEDAD